MTLQWYEGFDVCRNSASILRRYAAESVAGTWSWVAGVLQGFAMSSTTTNGSLVFPVQSDDEYIIGIRVNWVTASTISNAAAANADRICTLRIGATQQCKWVHTRDATDATKWRVSLVVGTTIIATSQALFGGQSYYLEMKVKMNTVATANGTYELKINQAVEFTGSGVTTASGGASDQVDTIQLDFDSSGTGSITVDDLYVLNTAGSVNNTYLGDQVVEEALATSDGPVLNFSIFPSSPTTHFDKIDDPATAAPDDDATYVLSSVAAQKDFWGFGPLTFLQGNLNGIQISASLRLTSAGSRNFHFRHRNSGGTEGAGSSTALTQTSYAPEKSTVFERNPISPGTAVWTVTDVNTGFFGLQVD